MSVLTWALASLVWPERDGESGHARQGTGHLIDQFQPFQ